MKIQRFVKNNDDNTVSLTPKNVKINSYIRVQGITYQLRGICYHNSDVKIGHFLSIVFKNDTVFFINDASVKTNCPTRLNNETIENKADLLFYEKIDEIDVNYDEWLDIKSLRKNCHSSKENQQVNDDSDGEILFIPDEMCNPNEIPPDISFIANADDYSSDYSHASY